MACGPVIRRPGLRAWLAQVGYRVRQFAGALAAPVDPAERSSVLEVSAMPRRLARLFTRLPRAYQAHALRVARQVQAGGSADPLLLQAALLHDIGKWNPATGHRVTLGVRMGTVLLRRLAGGTRLLRRLGAPGATPGAWRYPWYLQAHHAELGAALTAHYGADPVVVALVRYHEAAAPPLAPAQLARLRRLQAADDAA